MIPEFVAKFEAGKETLRAQFAAAHPDSYGAIVKSVVTLFSGEGSYGAPDPENIKELDFGSYQGSLIYVIPEKGYQPSDFWIVRVYYGSCSGCDTLEAIRGYSDDPPTAEQVNDYLTEALHIVQNIKKLDSALS